MHPAGDSSALAGRAPYGLDFGSNPEPARTFDFGFCRTGPPADFFSRVPYVFFSWVPYVLGGGIKGGGVWMKRTSTRARLGTGLPSIKSSATCSALRA